MTAFTASTPTVVDPAGNVIADVRCRRCSYNLRGLNQAWRCPECGTPVGLSVHGDLLCYSDPNWVAKLSKGVNLMLWGIVAVIAAAIINAIFANKHSAFGALISLGGSIVGLCGAWLLTEPDPSGFGEDRTVTARKVVRFALMASVAGQFVGFIAAISRPTPGAIIGFGVVGGLIGLVGVAGEFARLYYLEQIANRIPDAALAERARTIRWGYTASLAAVLFFGIIVAIAMAGTLASIAAGRMPAAGAGGVVGVSCFMGIAGLALLVFGVMYLIMLSRFNTVLAQQAEMARQIWAVAAPGAVPATVSAGCAPSMPPMPPVPGSRPTTPPPLPPSEPAANGRI